MDGFMIKRRKKRKMNKKADKKPEAKEHTNSRFRAIHFISHRNAIRDKVFQILESVLQAKKLLTYPYNTY